MEVNVKHLAFCFALGAFLIISWIVSYQLGDRNDTIVFTQPPQMNKETTITSSGPSCRIIDAENNVITDGCL